ncbi:hypothetical protein HZS_4800, partial [Henneguya salminicola]
MEIYILFTGISRIVYGSCACLCFLYSFIDIISIGMPFSVYANRWLIPWILPTILLSLEIAHSKIQNQIKYVILYILLVMILFSYHLYVLYFISLSVVYDPHSVCLVLIENNTKISMTK